MKEKRNREKGEKGKVRHDLSLLNLRLFRIHIHRRGPGICTLRRLLALSFTVILAVCTSRCGCILALSSTATGLHSEGRGKVLLAGRRSETGERGGVAVGGFRGIILALAIVFALFASSIGFAGALDAQRTIFRLRLESC